MIRINYFRAGDEHKLAVMGHAGYAEHGRDIICAGVSAISFALLDYLQHSECEIKEASVADGEMRLICKGEDVVRSAYEMAVGGYRQIAESYPQYVEIYIAAIGD